MHFNINLNYLYISLKLIQTIICVNIDTKFPITFTYQKTDSNSRDYENINGSYFGYSLSVTQQNDVNYVLIGAPKHDSPKLSPRVSRTGAIFYCQWKVSQTNRDVVCDEIDFSSGSRSARSRYINFDSPTINMNLGSSLSNLTSNLFVGCAHLWVSPYNTPIGKCYRISNSGEILGNFGPKRRIDHTINGRPLNTYLMSGFSSVSSQTIEDTIVLGAPGYRDYSGAVILNDDKERLELDRVLKDSDPRLPGFNNYLGYAITTGFFDSNLEYVVISAPRNRDFTGKVLIYPLKEFSEKDPDTFSGYLNEVIGEKEAFGEYFGASLLALDINNDKFDDLIVGAPFYSNRRNREIGRIYVFMMNKETLQFQRERLIVGHKSVGRFGTAMSSIDINLDEYRDAIISAPYESNSDGSLGAIYIYLGSEKGLDSIPHTRIGAESMQNQVLNGFGISIVSNVDFDRNGYEDLLIGSYLSENAILLRTKPIAKLSLSNISFKPNKIRLSETKCNNNQNFCFKVEYCVRYDGKHIRNKQLALITLDIIENKLRIKENRVKFGNNGKSEQKTVELNSGKNCFANNKSFNLMINEAKSLIDIITPIEVRLSVSLMNESSNSFCKDCPIAQSFSTFANIEFEHGCQSRTCTSRLTLTALSKYNGQKIEQNLTEGLHDTIDIDISVENSGEASINTAVDIKMTPILLDLTNGGDADRCKPMVNTSSYRCDVSQILQKGKKENLNLHFTVARIATNNIEIYFKVESSSYIENKSKLNASMKFEIIRKANLMLISETTNNFSYSDKTPKVPFQVSYSLMKSGPSSVFSAYFVFRLPVDVVVVDSESQAICKPITHESWAKVLPQTNKTLNLVCGNRSDYCATYRCSLPKFNSGAYSQPFILSLALIPSKIRNRDFNGINFQLNSEIKIEDKFRFETEIKSNASNSVFMARDVPIVDEEIEPWVLFLSAGFGVFILIITVIILIKKGFFRRKKLEEIAKVKQRMSMRPDLYDIKDLNFGEESLNDSDTD